MSAEAVLRMAGGPSRREREPDDPPQVPHARPRLGRGNGLQDGARGRQGPARPQEGSFRCFLDTFILIALQLL